MRHLPFLWFFALSPISHGCIWDMDTLAAENARFPGVQEILTGNFPRHSREFYEWRKAGSERAIGEDPSRIELYDDLAVAQHKLGDHQAAIETMKRKDSIKGDVYETYSNMGTFYIYTGELPKALWCINKALQINPNAHFGREKYQKWIIEWLMVGKKDDELRMTENLKFAPIGYAAFVLSRQPITAGKTMTEALRKEGVNGVLGMMRFADFDNPILQEAMGDLLMTGEAEANATYHATMAYTHAAAKTTEPATQQRLLEKAKVASSTILKDKEDPSKILQQELKKGQKLAATVRTEEMAWIAANKDASAEFQKKYLQP